MLKSLFNDRRQLLVLVLCVVGYTRVGISEVFMERSIVFESNADSLFYQHSGWFIADGATPYVSFWDPKPPANFLLTTAVSIVTPGDTTVLHLVHTTLSIAGIVGIVLLVYRISSQIVGQKSAIYSSLSLLSFTIFVTLPLDGYRPEIYMAFFGLLSIETQKPSLSGAFSALSAAFWQVGIIFVFLSLVNYSTREEYARLLGGIISTAVVVTAPFLVLSGVEPILTEVIIAPVVTTNEQTLFTTLSKLVVFFGYSGIILFFGAVGSVFSNRSRLPLYGLILSSLQIILLDFESKPDTILLVVFSSIGVALLVSAAEGRVDRIVRVTVSVMVVTSLLFYGGFGYLSKTNPEITDDASNPVLIEEAKRAAGIESVIRGDKSEVPENQSRQYMKNIYWKKIKPDSCRYRVGGMHRSWIEVSTAEITDKKCGSNWPIG